MLISFLFWLFWVADVLLLILNIMGSRFRASFGAGNSFGSIVTIVLVSVLVLAMLMRFSDKPRWISIAIAGLPFAGLFIMYMLDKK